MMGNDSNLPYPISFLFTEEDVEMMRDMEILLGEKMGVVFPVQTIKPNESNKNECNKSTD